MPFHDGNGCFADRLVYAFIFGLTYSTTDATVMTPISPAYRILPLGDAALLIDFGNTMDRAVNGRVQQLFHHFSNNPLPGLTDLVPAYSSLALVYDVMQVRQQLDGHATAFDKVAAVVRAQLAAGNTGPPVQGRQLRVPVCYHPSLAPDLEALAAQAGLPPAEAVALHTAPTYRVYMIGFLPGFAYMGDVAERIALPRKGEPRTRVAAGSVGIAGRQTGIYPLASPGGWQLIGRTPLRIFDKAAADPTLFRPGDEVTFYPITLHEFENYQGRPV